MNKIESLNGKTDKTYNGWTNHETWLVKLWLDNDEGVYRYWVDETAHYINQGDSGLYKLSKALQEWHEENTPTTSGVYADLLNSAMSVVNWREIAEALLEEHSQ